MRPRLSGHRRFPPPQFSYEDLGLVLKATPQVHGKLISLDYELTLRALGTTQSNGLPLLTNREIKGTISTEDGEGVVIAGMVDKDETSAINGYPLLSAIPVLGKAFSVETKEKTSDELLIVVTPHVTARTAAWHLTPASHERAEVEASYQVGSNLQSIPTHTLPAYTQLSRQTKNGAASRARHSAKP